MSEFRSTAARVAAGAGDRQQRAFARDLEGVVEKAVALTEEDKLFLQDYHPELVKPEFDPVTKPVGYTSGPACCAKCGTPIECIDVVEHMGFRRGNAMKYLWRAGVKDPSVEKTIQDLEKSIQYTRREINRLKGIASW